MPQRDVVVIGGSAGALQALTTIIQALPASLNAAILIVIHTRADSDGVLPQILSRGSSLPVSFALDGAPLELGRIYVARPDLQLLLTPDGMRVVRGPKENGFRPAIDPLFRTAARAYGPRVVGIILSGALDDGAFGLSVVKAEGGLTVVQHPEDAVIPAMPLSAMREVEVDFVLPAAEIPNLVARVSGEPVPGEVPMAKEEEPETQLPAEETHIADMEQLFGPPSALTCPDCGGALWEVADEKVTRYKCHVGHQYAPASLESEQREVVEGALWTAVRVLEEHAELRTRMAERAEAGGMRMVSEGFEEGARNARQQAQEIRDLLFSGVITAAPQQTTDRPARKTRRRTTP